jgi:hypothetical protein
MPNFRGTTPVQVKNYRLPVINGYSSTSGEHTQRNDLAAAKTISVPTGAGVWLVQANTQNVRFTLDGTTPTAAKGFLIVAGQAPIQISVAPGSSIKVIEVAPTAELEYQFLC